MSAKQSLTLPDGRILSYTTFGAEIVPQKPALFYFHGFPGAHSEGLPVHEEASKSDLCVVGVTRPGFGDSTFHPEFSLLSFADDVLCLADHLSIRRFGILGISGGGPFALACLYALPAERLRAVTVVSGMWPTNFSMGGMMLPLRIMHNVARWVPSVIGWVVGLELNDAVRDTDHPERLEELMIKGFRRWPEEDQKVIFGNEGKLLRVLVQSSRDALKHGTAGVSIEAGLYGSPWGFSLEELPTNDRRVSLWHGGKDANIPIAMAEKAIELMPGVLFHRYEEEAHLSLSMKYLGKILEELIGKLEG